jgi:hypothetical protein
MQSRVARFETIVYGKFGSYTLKTSEQIYNSTPNSNASLYSSTAYSSQAACFAALPAESAWSNNGSSSTSTGNINTNGTSAYGTTVSQPQGAVDLYLHPIGRFLLPVSLLRLYDPEYVHVFVQPEFDHDIDRVRSLRLYVGEPGRQCI